MIAAMAGLFTSAALLGYGLCWGTRALSPRVGLVDRPGEHRAHHRPTPLGGGVAIWAAMVLVFGAGTAWVFSGGPLPEGLAVHADGLRQRSGRLWAIVGLASVLMAMGLLDDRFRLPWAPRLGVQVLAAAGLVASGESITLFGPLALAPVSWLVTILWVVGLTNAFNFLDNMDGLSAGVGLIAALLFAGAQLLVDDLFVPVALVVLAGSLAGFLVHNGPPARLFMGDAGSNFLGFLLGALTVVGTFTKVGPGSGFARSAVLAPLVVMAVPLYDMASVVLIRLREGRSPFRPDHCHFSHRLVERGLTRPAAVRTIYLVTLAGGLGALLLNRLEEPWAPWVVLAQTLCVLGVVAILEGPRPAPATGPADRRPAPSEPPDADP